MNIIIATINDKDNKELIETFTCESHSEAVLYMKRLYLDKLSHICSSKEKIKVIETYMTNDGCLISYIDYSDEKEKVAIKITFKIEG